MALRLRLTIPRWWRQHWALGGLLALFVATATAYNVVTPLWEFPDEPGQFDFARYLAQGKGLPIQSFVAEENPVNYGHHPPLYFALGALSVWWSDLEGLDGPRENPAFFGFGTGAALNYFVHSRDEDFPYAKGVLAVRLVRGLSTLLGVATLVATYALARELFPASKALGLVAAAIVGFIPEFLAVSAAVNNDSLVIALSAWTTLVLVKALRPGASPRLAWALGLLLGLAALAKLSGLALFPVAGAVLLYKGFQGRSWGLFWRWAAPAVGVSALVAGWWYLRNWFLYGDPLAWRLWQAVRPLLVREGPLSWEDFSYYLPALHRSFWGELGWRVVFLPQGVYTAGLLLGILTAAGLGLFALRRLLGRSQDRMPGLPVVLLLGICLVFFLSVVRFFATFGHSGTQGRYLYPALPALAVLLIVALGQWWARGLPGADRARLGLGAILAGGMILLGIGTPLWVLSPAFALPQPLPPSVLEALPQRPRVNFGGLIELAGYELAAGEARPGQPVEVTLYWRSLAQAERDYKVFLHLVDVNGEPHQDLGDAFPLRGVFPTSVWRPGELLRDRFLFSAARDAPPGLYTVEMGLYFPDTYERLPVLDSQGQEVDDRVVLGRLKLPLEPVAAAKPQRERRATFGDAIELLGFDLNPRAFRPGQDLSITLYWRSLRSVSEEYTVFVHLLDAQGNLLAQRDEPPRGGRYPTSIWSQGEIVPDEHVIQIPPWLPMAAYQVRVGLYRWDTGQRLTLLGSLPQRDWVLLTRLRVRA